jgi:hypothetical protein
MKASLDLFLLCMHCTKSLKHIFLDFYIHVSGSDLYTVLPRLVLFGISIFLYCVKELSAQPQERREGQGTDSRLNRRSGEKGRELPPRD